VAALSFCARIMKRSRALGFSLEKKKSLSLLKNSETRVDLSVKSDEVPTYLLR